MELAASLNFSDRQPAYNCEPKLKNEIASQHDVMTKIQSVRRNQIFHNCPFDVRVIIDATAIGTATSATAGMNTSA